MVPTEQFKLHLNPWPAQRPDDVANPGSTDAVQRRSLQKYERLLRYARERDVIVSVIFYIGGQVLAAPFAAGSVEEDLYYRYGVARLAAFSNVTWDLGNEYNFHRPAPAWADQMGCEGQAVGSLRPSLLGPQRNSPHAAIHVVRYATDSALGWRTERLHARAT